MANHIEQFTEFMREHGHYPEEPILDDGIFHDHVRDTQDKSGKKNLWYILYGDGIPAGSFGHYFLLPEGKSWQAKADKTLTAEQREQINKRRTADKIKREQAQQEVHAECISKAERMLAAAHDVSADLDYIVSHKIIPYGAKQLKDMLLIPLYKDKILTGLQIITKESKKFLTGTKKAGAYLAIKGTGKTVYLVEGWADACKIHELTNATVIVCFDCGNLLEVGKSIRAAGGNDYDMVYVADNDRFVKIHHEDGTVTLRPAIGEENTGITKATAAALATGARLARPTFSGDDGKDVCDLSRISGNEAVISCLEAAKLVEPIEEADPVKKFDLSRLTKGRDIAAGDDTVTFIVDKLIPENSLILLYAKGGSGKSTVVTQIAGAVESGTPFIGLNTLKRPVVVIDYENPKAILHKRINIVKGADEVFFWLGIDNPPQLNKVAWLELKTLVTTLKNPLIIIDTLSSSCSGLDILSNGDYSPVMQRLVKLRNLGATIILLHHTPKQDETKYIGASCIYNQVDHVLAMYPVKNASDEKEVADEDDAKVYRFGTKDKTRFEHFAMYVEFDEDTSCFVPAENPDQDIIEQLRKLIIEQKEINQTGIINQIGATVPKKKIKRLLNHNEGKLWTVEKGERNAKIYRPVFSYSVIHPIGTENRITEIQLSTTPEKQTDNDTMQTLINSELVSYSAPLEQLEQLAEINSMPDFDF